MLYFVSSHVTKRSLTCQPLWCQDPCRADMMSLRLNVPLLLDPPQTVKLDPDGQ